MGGVSIKLDGYDELLAEINRIEDSLTREDFLASVVEPAAQIVSTRAKQLCPRNPKDDKQIPLYATIGVVIRKYAGRVLAMIGPQWEYARHGHLVEFGHDIVARGEGKKRGRKRVKGGKRAEGRTTGRVEPHAFMRPAFDGTQGEQMAAMTAVAAAKVRELGGE
jgi:hypothetical protein